MKNLNSNEIRQLWLDFFKSKDHYLIDSASLIPINDKSLLWVNSGVATLKSYFSGLEKPPSERLTNSQKVIRTNDIENVGKTSRHHTFFEMLGNFSIGGYFKKEAITWAWEFLTSKDWLDISPNKLYVTVFFEDTEAYLIWSNIIKLSENKIIKGTKKTNFWDVGLGPCGPNSEIFYDRGEKYDSRGSELITNDIENDRFIEIWNIVFSEFNNDGNNNYQDLPQKNIDTGAGLERIVAISQNVPTNFDSDLFLDLIRVLEKITPDFHYEIDNYFSNDSVQKNINLSYKIIVDHARTVIFAISDGAAPSNKERGYILRRLLRRAIIHGLKLNIDQSFLQIFIKPLIKKMNHFYPNLKKNEELIKTIMNNEENKFRRLLQEGQIYLNDIIKNKKMIPGEDAFKLFDTYGFPFEITKEICDEQNIVVDEKRYRELYQKHILLSRQNQKFSIAMVEQKSIVKDIKQLKNVFVGYKESSVQAKCLFIFQNDSSRKSLLLEETGYCIFDKTVFYAEAGGQSADIGTIISLDKKNIIQVLDVQKSINNLHIHKIEVIAGKIETNVDYNLSYDQNHRKLITNNHTATHMLVVALCEVLKEEIKQAGSFLEPNKLRFDFLTAKRINNETLIKVVEKVNEIISTNLNKEEKIINISDAKKLNITMNFEERYGEMVRVIKYGNICPELCGGTHVSNLSEIEQFDIISYENKGSGVYRIVAMTTKLTINNYYKNQHKKISNIIENEYKTLQKCPKNSQIEELYIKIKEFNFFDFASFIEYQKLTELFKNKAKVYIMQSKNKLVELESNKIVENILSNEDAIINNNLFLYMIENNDFSESIRQASLKLINIHQNKVFLLLTPDGNFTLQMNNKLSIEFNLETVFKNLQKEFNIKGGGRSNSFQGKITDNFSMEMISKIINENN